MRFDDRIATVLGHPEPDVAARAAKWRQLADLLAQRPRGGEGAECAAAYAYLRDNLDVVGAASRAALRETYPPSIPDRLGSLLGHRAAPPAACPSADDARARIRDIARRVAALRPDSLEHAVAGEADTGGAGFRWECGADGLLSWVADVPRGPLIGLSLAAAAPLGASGADAAIAASLARRAPFRDCPLHVAGHGPASGEWLMSGVPVFDGRGAFAGYRGTAGRPGVDCAAHAVPPGLPVAPDAVRQLVHELRTPLNAIAGFAELIEGQYLGANAPEHRTRADAIRGSAARLLHAVDDLDIGARALSAPAAMVEAIDLAALLARVGDRYRALADDRGVRLRFAPVPGPVAAAATGEAAERMVDRLLAAVIAIAGEGEEILVVPGLTGVDRRTMACLSLDRPRALAGLDAQRLLDPALQVAEGTAASLLGLGFTLRLVRGLAEAAGGAMLLGADRLMLCLPEAAAEAAGAARDAGAA